MKTKYCPKCKETKNVDLFRNNKNQLDGLCTICKLCCKNYEQKAYNKNKQKYVANSAQHKKKKLELYLQYKKTLCCQSCGENRYWVLDFHHVNPETKLFDIASRSSIVLNNIMDEINKCIPLCRNCHFEYHHMERKQNITIHQYLDLKQHDSEKLPKM